MIHIGDGFQAARRVESVVGTDTRGSDQSATPAAGQSKDVFETSVKSTAVLLPIPAAGGGAPPPPADDERSAQQVALDNDTGAAISTLEREETRFERIDPGLHPGVDITDSTWNPAVTRNLISHLANAGYPPGGNDAMPGGGSLAIAAFQSAEGLPSTGIVDTTTWNALVPYSAPVNAPAALSLGDQSNQVLYLQLELKQFYPQLDYTGVYDHATALAVADFKSKHGIVSSNDDSAGWVTQQALATAVRGRPGFSGAIHGVDVSGWQPQTNWATVRSQTNIRFAFIKATEGLDQGYYEAQFGQDWKESRANGVIRSPYCFFHADEDPIKQADEFLGIINANGGLRPTDLPPMLDLEYTYGVSPQKTLDNALAWCKEIEAKTGRKPIIYTYLPWWNGEEPDKWGNSMAPDQYTGAARQHFVDTLRQLGQFPLFISDVGRSEPRVPFPWTSYFAYQYSFDGRPAGIPSNAGGGVTDLDRLSIDFQGLIDAGYISAGTPPAAPPPAPPRRPFPE
jgi:GH25 family lysozyme M1 (1,4-beta-N-acetylmuramidase)